jgi:hypothetical protein
VQLAASNNNRTFNVSGSPRIHGNARVGQTVEVAGRNNVFSPAPTSWRYQWLRNGNPIPNATGRTYTIRNADAGTELSVRVTARRNGFANRTLTLASIRVEEGPIRFGQETRIRMGNVGDNLLRTFRAPFDATAQLRARGDVQGWGNSGRFFEPLPGNAFWVMEVRLFNESTSPVRETIQGVFGFQSRQGIPFIQPCPWAFGVGFYGIIGANDVTVPARGETTAFYCVEAPANAFQVGQFGWRSNNSFTRMFANP